MFVGKFVVTEGVPDVLQEVLDFVRKSEILP